MKKKHKPLPRKSTSTSSAASSSVSTGEPASTISPQQKYSEQLEIVLLTPLSNHDEFTMGDFILRHILLSLNAVDITNGQKKKYIKIIEQFLSSFVQKTDEAAKTDEATKNLCESILHRLILTREHLKIEEDEEAVIKYLLNSKVLSENLFNPNRLNKDNLTLLDLVESLQNVLNTKSDIQQNKKLIQWLKDKKGAKNASEILQKFNQKNYDENVEKLKEKLAEYSVTSTQKLEGYVVVSKKEEVSAESLGTSAKLLECFYVILNNKIDEIPRHMKLFLRVSQKNNESYIVQVCVVDKFLKECYKGIYPDSYINIICSIIGDMPLNSLKITHYEELIWRYIKIGSLTKRDEELLDDYTRELVKLTVDNNSGVTNSDKHHAYKLRLYYCKHKGNLQETIKVSLELMKYANDTQMGKDLYGLLIALYNIESGSFKNDILDHLVSKFNLSGEAKKLFIALFSYHNFDRAFVKKIQEELEIIKQAFSTQSQEIRTTIKEFSDGFIMQTGEYSVGTIQKIVNASNFKSDTPESTLRILSCLKYWSKNKIEKIDYQKVLDKLLKKDFLGRDLITVIKVADLYLTIEDLVQTKHYLDLAENLLKPRKSFQYEIEPKIYLNEVKLGFILKVFADNDDNKEFLKENWSYIKQIYKDCEAIRGEFSSAYQSILDICQYYLLSIDSTTKSNSEGKIKNVINKIAEDDEVTFSLEIINQTISEEQQIVISANDHIDSSNRDLEEYSSEGKSKDTATTQEDSSYKENFVTKCLNHWTIIHQYYQNIKKSNRSSHDKTSDHPKENHQVWHISNDVSYTCSKTA
ncbi:hypothetical protein [Candidatus Tisiphia endosymbiont of Hybos culiciformis]|uniref:hypothetical protein n=1 Tax=Candidatus Tisiphia endosymbiont of Hybos culiciformis TaxID=3139331 RepID=UPI003CCB4DC8